MKKIGFIDYYLDEWHANNYPAWIRESGLGFEVAYAYGELERPPFGGMTTDEWCASFGAERCDSIAELCEKADYIMILSPDNAEKHLEYAKEAFPCGKSCYVDKTFAPDSGTAAEIFALAEKHGVKMFSSSALRFADELEAIKGSASSVNIIGSGNLENYLIHFAELAVILMGTDVKSVMSVGTEANVSLSLFYPDGRIALLNMLCAHSAPSFCISVEAKDGTETEFVDVQSPYFVNMLHAILAMFDGAEAPVTSKETLALMKLIDAARQAIETPYTRILL